MRFGITILALGGHPFIEISAEEFSKVKAAKQNLVILLGIEEKYDLAIENYAEFDSELLKLTLKNMLFDDLDWSSFRGDIQLINRRLANVLTAVKLYTDQVQHDLASIYGKNSQELANLRSSLSQEYDNSLGYKVVAEMRNYIQHRSLPIGGLSYPSRWENMDSEVDRRLRFSIEPRLYVNNLKDDPKFKPAVLAELEAKTTPKRDHINFTPLLRQCVEAVSRIHQTVRDITQECMKDWDSTFLGILDRAREPMEGDLTGLGIVEELEDETYGEMIHVFEDLVFRRISLMEKNRSLNSLSRWYVSGICAKEDA